MGKRKTLFVVLVLSLLSLMLILSYVIRPVASKPGVYLMFTISKAGQIGDASGILVLYDTDTGDIFTWYAGSGDNDPAHQCWKWDNSDNDPWGGPIPSGIWQVYQRGSNNKYRLEMNNICGNRGDFYIHGSSECPAKTTHGCIAVVCSSYQDFKDKMDCYWPVGIESIPLYVSYGGDGGDGGGGGGGMAARAPCWLLTLASLQRSQLQQL